MKKSLFLTSVLALAACGGGTGSGSGGARPSTPVNLGTQYSRIACNQARTQCKGVDVDSNGNIVARAAISSKVLSRSATSRGHVDIGGDEWDLFYADDIVMNVIYSPGDVGKQTFIVDDSTGDIIGLKWSADDEKIKDFVPGVILSGMEYIGDNKFSLKAYDKNGKLISDGTLEFENYSDLRFANFGVGKVRGMKWWKEDDQRWADLGEGNMDIPFAGGYENARQNPRDHLNNSNTVYTGTSRGMLEYAGNVQDYLNIIAEGATLTLDTTDSEKITETFTGDFVNADGSGKAWHTVTAVKDGDSITFGFSGENENDSKFTMVGAANTTENTAKIFETGYYSGDKTVATEASGLFQYQEVIDPSIKEANSDAIKVQENNRTLYIGFGGKH